MITCGTPYSSEDTCPAKLAYQVCECTRSVPSQPGTIARSTPMVLMAPLAPASSSRSAYAVVPASSRGLPNACTRVSSPSMRRRARTSSATCTPAPPYTSGGYSLLTTSMRTLMKLPLPAQCRAPATLAGMAAKQTIRHRKNVLAIVLAGGEGKRLMPLTADRAKPAVPFAGIYRLIDFALSNVVNSGYLQDRRADPVQVAQPRPPRHADLADVDDARQLRDAGARRSSGSASTGTSAAPTRSSSP